MKYLDCFDNLFLTTAAMKKRFTSASLALLLMLGLLPSAFAQQGLTPDTEVSTDKLAQTGMKFLSVSVDPRASAIGSALTADFEGNSTSMFYNPASMAFMPGKFSAAGGILQFIADISYTQASLAFKPGDGRFGVIGLSLVSVDNGDFLGTVRASNDAGFIDTGTYSPTQMAIGLGYARAFGDRFSAGANIKYAMEDLGSGFVTSQVFETNQEVSSDSYSESTLAYDFGVLYSTGFRSLTIAMMARNFAAEQTYVRERFELPLTFQIGVSMDVVDFTSLDPDMHQLQLNIDAQRPRDFREHLRFGLEYTFMGMASIRGGFEQAVVSEEQGFSAGAGLNISLGGNARVGADYAFTDFGLFGSVHRVGLNVGF